MLDFHLFYPLPRFSPDYGSQWGYSKIGDLSDARRGVWKELAVLGDYSCRVETTSNVSFT